MKQHFPFTLYIEPETAWKEMLSYIEGAKWSVYVEQYIFENDSIGQIFSEALVRKARQGVDVYILCDGAGSYYLKNSILEKQMRNAGVKIQFFNPVQPWLIHTFTSWFFRDHRKMLVIDHKIVFTGGLGIRDDMRTWRDTVIKTEGEIAKDFEHYFFQMWEKSKKNIFFRMKYIIPSHTTAEIVTNAPRFKQRFLYHQIISAIRQARERIYITTPYFIPDIRFQKALRAAARKGVDVRVLVPYSSDVIWVDRVARSFFHSMLKSGVAVYRYLPTFIHTKTIVIDNTWSTIGSFNLDSLSFRYNYEANIVSLDRALNNDLAAQFLHDIQFTERLHLLEWERRPFSQKIMEWLSWPLRKIL